MFQANPFAKNDLFHSNPFSNSELGGSNQDQPIMQSRREPSEDKLNSDSEDRLKKN